MTQGGAVSRGGDVARRVATSWCGAVALLRPLNLAVLWLAVEAGSKLSGGPAASPAALVPVLTAAFGYARNDAVDREADARNRPGRPVPAGLVSRPTAFAISWTLMAGAAALMLAFVRDPARWALFGGGGLLLFLYSPWLKSLGPAGPLTVSALAAMAVAWGGLSGPAAARSLAAAALAGVVTFARECAKDLEDHPGDRAAEKATWPVRSGEAPPRAALRAASGAGLFLIPVPWALGHADARYLVVAAAIALPVLTWSLVHSPRTPEDAGRLSRRLKLALIAGIVGLWIGGIGAAPR